MINAGSAPNALPFKYSTPQMTDQITIVPVESWSIP